MGGGGRGGEGERCAEWSERREREGGRGGEEGKGGDSQPSPPHPHRYATPSRNVISSYSIVQKHMIQVTCAHSPAHPSAIHLAGAHEAMTCGFVFLFHIAMALSVNLASSHEQLAEIASAVARANGVEDSVATAFAERLGAGKAREVFDETVAKADAVFAVQQSRTGGGVSFFLTCCCALDLLLLFSFVGSVSGSGVIAIVGNTWAIRGRTCGVAARCTAIVWRRCRLYCSGTLATSCREQNG